MNITKPRPIIPAAPYVPDSSPDKILRAASMSALNMNWPAPRPNVKGIIRRSQYLELKFPVLDFILPQIIT